MEWLLALVVRVAVAARVAVPGVVAVAFIVLTAQLLAVPIAIVVPAPPLARCLPRLVPARGVANVVIICVHVVILACRAGPCRISH